MLKTGFISVLLILCCHAFGSSSDLQTISRVIESVEKKYAPDKRIAVFEVKTTEHEGLITLKGKTNLTDAKQVMLDSLTFLKIGYLDSVSVLPDQSVGDKPWALATLSVANMRSAPDHASELVSQALMGTPVKVLEAKDGWFYIQTPDWYIGWVDENGIALKTEAEMAAWKQAKRYLYNQLSGIALDAPKRKASTVSDLVLGDLFEIISMEKKYLQVKFPDGRKAFVKKADCLSYDDWISRKPEVKNVLSVTKELLGTTYLWGGTSCKAVDCSGMIKTAWYSQSVILARDASQQARYGEKIDFSNKSNLQPGDMLFFGRNANRITHVGIYLGNGRYIHASGMVRINSIDQNDTLYNITERKKLVGATRIVNSLGSEGIVPVKQHGWY
ncbi:MAG TPA: C40 family peptidase [Prolixibacteraceae bacterium]|nr:C40 family peptidase [Prolixibacteraceae bacterium]